MAGIAIGVAMWYDDKKGGGNMTLEKFRILHSTLIEHYQFIEAHLEGIYAALLDKPFGEGIREIERDSLSGVVREIREIEKEQNIWIHVS